MNIWFERKQKKYFPLTRNLEENLQTLLHVVVKKEKMHSFPSPGLLIWDSRF